MDLEAKTEYVKNCDESEEEIQWFDDQMFQVLALKSKGTHLQIIRNLTSRRGLRGGLAWHKMTRDVAAKTGARLEHLIELALNPKTPKNYQEAMGCIEVWESHQLELKKIDNQDLTGLTKRLSGLAT